MNFPQQLHTTSEKGSWGGEEEATMAASPDRGIGLGNHFLNYFISEFKIPSVSVLKGAR